MEQSKESTAKSRDQDLVVVKDLVKYFPIKGGILQRVQAWVRAVDGISFTIKKGETLGLVGESGCGKTTVGRTILRLIPATSGEVLFEGRDVLALKKGELKELRRDMQIIFQDPFSSLDPRMPIGESIGEGLLVHKMADRTKRHREVIEALVRVQMRADHARRFPHEFSGGQRQRIGIARALIMNPKFIVCDEPVSALDVSVQSQVLNILMDLQEDLDLTYLFIAHNLSVVEHISTRVAVMYVGKMAELCEREEFFRKPLHPYAQALMSAVPVPDPTHKRDRIILKGDVPSPLNPPTGCRFHPRCPVAIERCSEEEPPFKDYGAGHFVACWLLE
jgi:oligopeptide/dipeptide ABC transporter ATP-binding protein